MKNDNNFLKNISVSKHGIHDIILELTYKFNFHKLLLHGNLNMVFVALCIGLILFNNPTATHIAQKLGWVSHDAITRPLPLISVNNNNIIILFIQAIQSQTACLGYLIIDDVIIRKPYGKSIFPTSYVYDHTNMINFVHKFGLAAEYVTFDTWYASKALLTLLKKHGYSYVCMIKNNRKVLYNNRFNFNVRTICLLHSKKQFRYYPGTGFYIKAVTVILPGAGKVKLAIVKNGYNASIENTRFIITDMLDTPAQSIVKKYLCRWDIETFFRDIKQYLNFEKVQARDPKKLEGYFSAMFISFVFIQILQVQNNFNTVGETVSFLQDFVQIKVNNVVYIINVTSKHLNSKQVIDVTNPVATTIWDKLSA